MPYQPRPNDELRIDDRLFHVAEHPAAPGVPYGQEGRAAIVYQLHGRDGPCALKVFKPRFRVPALVSLADELAPYAQVAGLEVCRRTVLSPTRHLELLRQHPDLTYAVVMPWIAGPTWTDTITERRALPREDCLLFGYELVRLLAHLEQQGVAHCDLSAANLLLPALAAGRGANRNAIALVDVEQLFGPELHRPATLPAGSPGYSHASPDERSWSAAGDRFAGAVLVSELLGWSNSRVRNAAWGESYFAPSETQQRVPRFEILRAALAEEYGPAVATLADRTWSSGSLDDCPTLGEWFVALPEPRREPVPPADPQISGPGGPPTPRQVEPLPPPPWNPPQSPPRRDREQIRVDPPTDPRRRTTASPQAVDRLVWVVLVTLGLLLVAMAVTMSRDGDGPPTTTDAVVLGPDGLCPMPLGHEAVLAGPAEAPQGCLYQFDSSEVVLVPAGWKAWAEFGWVEAGAPSVGQDLWLFPDDFEGDPFESDVVDPGVTDTPTRTAAPQRPTSTDIPPPVLVPLGALNLRADSLQLAGGTCTTLRWDLDGANRLLLIPVNPAGEVIDLPISNSSDVCPPVTTVYQLVARGDGDQEHAEHITIGVTQPPVVEFSSDTQQVVAGQCATLRWRTENIDTVHLDGKGVAGVSQEQVCPSATTTYTLRVRYRDGTQREFTVTIEVKPPERADVRFWADSYEIDAGDCTDVHWSVQNIDSVYFEGRGVTGDGSKEVCPDSTTTYSLRVKLRGGEEQTHSLEIVVNED